MFVSRLHNLWQWFARAQGDQIVAVIRELLFRRSILSHPHELLLLARFFHLLLPSFDVTVVASKLQKKGGRFLQRWPAHDRRSKRRRKPVKSSARENRAGGDSREVWLLDSLTLHLSLHRHLCLQSIGYCHPPHRDRRGDRIPWLTVV